MENIHWLQTIVSAVVFFLIGWLWYSEILFGRGWKKLMKVNKKDTRKSKISGRISKNKIHMKKCQMSK